MSEELPPSPSVNTRDSPLNQEAQTIKSGENEAKISERAMENADDKETMGHTDDKEGDKNSIEGNADNKGKNENIDGNGD